MLTALASSCSIAPTPPRTLPPITGNACALGYDFGTSGVRCAIVDASGEIVANPPGYSWGVAGERAQEASDWEEALFSQLAALPADARARVSRIAVSGTSGSMLLVDGDGAPAASRGSPRMYDFSVSKQAVGDSGEAALALLRRCTPEGRPSSGGRLLRLGLRMVGDCHIGHPVRSATSALAKLLAYHFESPLAGSERLAHQVAVVLGHSTAQLHKPFSLSHPHTTTHNSPSTVHETGGLRRLAPDRRSHRLRLAQRAQARFRRPRAPLPGVAHGRRDWRDRKGPPSPCSAAGRADWTGERQAGGQVRPSARAR